jgi:lipoprotein NlpD
MKGTTMRAGMSCLRAASMALVLGAVLAACGSRGLNQAPVEDRGAGLARPAVAAAQPVVATQPLAPAAPAALAAPASVPPAGADNAGKPGYYTVKPGDTLIRIGLDHGQSSRDLARWNSLENPNRLEIGQVLRVTPPAAAASANTRPVAQATATPSPLTQQAPADRTPAPAAAASAPQAGASAPASAPPANAAGASADDNIAWVWPSNGPVLAGFDEVKNKGLDIGGAAGDPVLAAADGRVVYVGAGLRGYGNLIILKHNNTYLTAYAHNQTLLIKEDQSVRKGQKIAEMGSSDADRVKLHFEVRRQGKPVDPAKYLPPK